MKNFDNKQEKTLVLVKPDGVQRGLIGETIKRYEQCGLKLVAIKMTIPSKKVALAHYSVDPEWAFKTGTKSIEAWKAKGLTPPTEDPIELAEGVRKQLITFLNSGPVVAMVWQGMNAIGVVRKITGGTEPLTSVPGTIRGDYTIDSYRASDVDKRAVRNIIHASGSIEESEKEMAIWFKPEEIISYRLISEAIIYDINLDGILE
ncbi:MAG: nucleoside-diphosphate kinase [Candidatus Shapirobacteria bacterium]|nr:nucleoside-diphosphate kinase [Candidatus Shapirobacteria bacterium]